jgi:hypothetical protein
MLALTGIAFAEFQASFIYGANPFAFPGQFGGMGLRAPGNIAPVNMTASPFQMSAPRANPFSTYQSNPMPNQGFPIRPFASGNLQGWDRPRPMTPPVHFDAQPRPTAQPNNWEGGPKPTLPPIHWSSSAHAAGDMRRPIVSGPTAWRPTAWFSPLPTHPAHGGVGSPLDARLNELGSSTIAGTAKVVPHKALGGTAGVPVQTSKTMVGTKSPSSSASLPKHHDSIGDHKDVYRKKMDPGTAGSPATTHTRLHDVIAIDKGAQSKKATATKPNPSSTAKAHESIAVSKDAKSKSTVAKKPSAGQPTTQTKLPENTSANKEVRPAKAVVKKSSSSSPAQLHDLSAASQDAKSKSIVAAKPSAGRPASKKNVHEIIAANKGVRPAKPVAKPSGSLSTSQTTILSSQARINGQGPKKNVVKSGALSGNIPKSVGNRLGGDSTESHHSGNVFDGMIADMNGQIKAHLKLFNDCKSTEAAYKNAVKAYEQSSINGTPDQRLLAYNRMEQARCDAIEATIRSHLQNNGDPKLLDRDLQYYQDSRIKAQTSRFQIETYQDAIAAGKSPQEALAISAQAANEAREIIVQQMNQLREGTPLGTYAATTGAAGSANSSLTSSNTAMVASGQPSTLANRPFALNHGNSLASRPMRSKGSHLTDSDSYPDQFGKEDSEPADSSDKNMLFLPGWNSPSSSSSSNAGDDSSSSAGGASSNTGNSKPGNSWPSDPSDKPGKPTGGGQRPLSNPGGNRNSQSSSKSGTGSLPNNQATNKQKKSNIDAALNSSQGSLDNLRKQFDNSLGNKGPSGGGSIKDFQSGNNPYYPLRNPWNQPTNYQDLLPGSGWNPDTQRPQPWSDSYNGKMGKILPGRTGKQPDERDPASADYPQFNGWGDYYWTRDFESKDVIDPYSGLPTGQSQTSISTGFAVTPETVGRLFGGDSKPEREAGQAWRDRADQLGDAANAAGQKILNVLNSVTNKYSGTDAAAVAAQYAKDTKANIQGTENARPQKHVVDKSTGSDSQQWNRQQSRESHHSDATNTDSQADRRKEARERVEARRAQQWQKYGAQWKKEAEQDFTIEHGKRPKDKQAEQTWLRERAKSLDRYSDWIGAKGAQWKQECESRFIRKNGERPTDPVRLKEWLKRRDKDFDSLRDRLELEGEHSWGGIRAQNTDARYRAKY